MADEAKKFKKRYKGPLSDVERGFLDAVVHLELAASRRRRLAVVGGFVGLSALVIGAMVLAVIFQRASEREKQQNRTIIEAKQEAEHQLALANERERQRQAAEDAKRKVEADKQVVDTKLGESEESLRETNRQLTLAMNEALANEERAKVAKRAAEDAAAAAKRSQAEAVSAKDEALKAKAEAERLYKEQYARAERMKKQLGSSIVDDLK
ncbi:MAG: hypothetical protein ACTHU0_03835, partial [Kofleriaceae bacterium]